MQEISHNMLSSSFPGQITSVSSTGAIRMKLYRQHLSNNPRPKLPKTFEDFMSTDIPDEFSKTSDGGKFLVYKEYVDGEPLVVFISD